MVAVYHSIASIAWYAFILPDMLVSCSCMLVVCQFAFPVLPLNFVLLICDVNPLDVLLELVRCLGCTHGPGSLARSSFVL